MGSYSDSKTNVQDNKQLFEGTGTGAGDLISADANQALPGSIAADLGDRARLDQKWDNVNMNNYQYTPEIASTMRDILDFSLGSQSLLVQAAYDKQPHELTTALPKADDSGSDDEIDWTLIAAAVGLLLFLMR